jgi:hypothetical protein
MAEEENSKVRSWFEYGKKKKAHPPAQFLPTSVRPIHYVLTLTPDLDKRKLYGEIDITVEVKKPT